MTRPPICQMGRKKGVQYGEHDARLNKIRIELRTEEVRLRNLADGTELPAKQLAEILELLESLDKYANALRRHGGDFSDYVEHRHKGTQELPRHLVKVRDGNDETVQYFNAEAALAKYGAENPDSKIIGKEESDT